MRSIRRRLQISGRWLWVAVAVGVVVSLAAYPLKVTPDGFTYVSSARSIFSDLAQTNFLWVREPGYPLFLRVVTHLFGTGDWVISSGQAVMMAGSLALVAWLFFKSTSRKIHFLVPVGLCFAYLIPQYFGYSSMILKQPLIGVVLPLAALLLSKSTTVREPGRVVLLIVLTLFGAAIVPLVSFNLKYFWVLVAAAISIALTARKFRLIRNYSTRKTIFLRSIALLAFLLAMPLTSWAIANKSLERWDNYKFEQTDGSAPDSSYGLEEGETLKDSILNPIRTVQSIWRETPKLLMIAPSDNAFGVKENDLYTLFQADPYWVCGAYDEYNYEPYSSFGRYIAPTCRSRWAQGVVKDLHSFGSDFYVLCSWSLLIAPIVMLIRRKYQLLFALLSPFLFIFMYGVHGGYTIDRYGHPLFPFAFVSLMFLVASIGASCRWVLKYARSISQRRRLKISASLKPSDVAVIVQQ
jgi:hypothetical protein